MILDKVKKIRQRQPKVGTRKLHRMVNEQLKNDGIQIGRDRLFGLLRAHKLLIKPRRRYKQTTYSRHRFRKYGNLIRGIKLMRPNQLYVADITYIFTLEGYCYLALITDAYSRKIVGYNLSRSLGIDGCFYALKMALEPLSGPANLIHHSDRGIQYCSQAYVDLLCKHGVQISMTEENHVYENALAERVNGILKNEFLLGENLASFAVAKELVEEAIHIYNTERLHLSLNYMTPEMKHAE